MHQLRHYKRRISDKHVSGDNVIFIDKDISNSYCVSFASMFHCLNGITSVFNLFSADSLTLFYTFKYYSRFTFNYFTFAVFSLLLLTYFPSLTL
jgi:hypothetical protein